MVSYNEEVSIIGAAPPRSPHSRQNSTASTVSTASLKSDKKVTHRRTPSTPFPTQAKFGHSLPSPAYSEFPPYETDGMISKVKKLLHIGGPGGASSSSESGGDLRELPASLSLSVPSSLNRGLSTSSSAGRRSSHQLDAEQQLEQFAKDKEVENIVSQPRLDLPVERKYGHHRKGSRGASISLAKDVVRNGQFF